MPRVNVWLPDELHQTVRTDLEGVNLSAVLQDGLRALLDCRHERAVCASCAAPVDIDAARADAVHAMTLDVVDRLRPLLAQGTVEGAGRIVVDVAAAHGAPGIAAPRPPQRRRRTAALPAPPPLSDSETSAELLQLPAEADSRRRHPTARPTAAPGAAHPRRTA